MELDLIIPDLYFTHHQRYLYRHYIHHVVFGNNTRNIFRVKAGTWDSWMTFKCYNNTNNMSSYSQIIISNCNHFCPSSTFPGYHELNINMFKIKWQWQQNELRAHILQMKSYVTIYLFYYIKFQDINICCLMIDK